MRRYIDRVDAIVFSTHDDASPENIAAFQTVEKLLPSLRQGTQIEITEGKADYHIKTIEGGARVIMIRPETLSQAAPDMEIHTCGGRGSIKTAKQFNDALQEARAKRSL